jgi:hypothetical protein
METPSNTQLFQSNTNVAIPNMYLDYYSSKPIVGYASIHVHNPDAPLKSSDKIVCPLYMPKPLLVDDDSTDEEPQMQRKNSTYNWRKENAFPEPPEYPDMDTDCEVSDSEQVDNEQWVEKLLEDCGTEYTTQPNSPVKRSAEEEEDNTTPTKKSKL